MKATQAHPITFVQRADALRDLPATQDIALLAVRAALTWIFVYHGAETLFGAFHGVGLHTTSLFYADIAHLRPGMFFAVLGGSIEFFGGIAIAAGILSRLAALALLGDMVMAMITVTFKNGVATDSATLHVGGGYEINVALAALAAALLLLGAGRFSLDAVLGPKVRAFTARGHAGLPRDNPLVVNPGGFLTRYRSVEHMARSNLSRLGRSLQSWGAQAELSVRTERDADAIFLQAVEHNLVSRQAVEVAATVGAIDFILAGATGIDTLASECEVDPDAITRLLRVLEAQGLVQIVGDKFVQVTPAGMFLASSSPSSWRARLDQGGMGRRMDEAVFHGLLSSIRTGHPAYEQVHGLPFWEDVQAHGLTNSFQAHMRPHVGDLGPELASLREIADATTVLDLCGGDGALLEVLLDHNPHLLGSLLELPEAAALARDRFRESEVGSRVSIYSGNVFDYEPSEHDVCLLCWVLHDWSDDQARRILETSIAATTTRGQVIVIERPRDGSRAVLEADLRMLVFFGGRERSTDEWRKLFDEAGLTTTRETPISTGGFVAYSLERSGRARLVAPDGHVGQT